MQNQEKNRVKNENYIVIQGWMLKELQLTGTELLLFAIIYGFSQDENTKFTGSLKYLADWTNTSKQTCSSNLTSLINKGYIAKEDFEINGVKYCKYYSIVNFDTIQKVCTPIQKVCTNKLIDNIDQTKLNKFNLDIVENDNIKSIIDYLNNAINSNYRYTTKGTISLIKARFKDGYELEDFYTVINNQVKEWLNDPKMCKYLRPETLFGNKFESYLNNNIFKGKTKSSYSSNSGYVDNTKDHVKIHHISDEEFNKLTFDEKLNEMTKFDAIANMTPLQKQFYNEYCLARDENGNLLEY